MQFPLLKCKLQIVCACEKTSSDNRKGAQGKKMGQVDLTKMMEMEMGNGNTETTIKFQRSCVFFIINNEQPRSHMTYSGINAFLFPLKIFVEAYQKCM